MFVLFTLCTKIIYIVFKINKPDEIIGCSARLVMLLSLVVGVEFNLNLLKFASMVAFIVVGVGVFIHI